MLQHAVIVNLNSVNMQDDDVTPSSAYVVSSDHRATSSEDAVQPPQSAVIMAVAEQRVVKSGKVAREKTVAVTAPVKSSNAWKSTKRQSSSSRLHEPCSKRLRRDQKFQSETTNAEWTESLFTSEASEAGRDTSAVDTEELNATPSTVAAVSAVTYTPSVSEGGQFETASLKTLPQPNSGTLSSSTTSGQTLIHTDDVCCDTSIADGTGDCQSDSASSHIVNTCLSQLSPAVQRTMPTDTDDNIQQSSPSSAGHVVKTTLSLSPNSVTQSCPSSTSQTVFLVPVHTKSVTTSGTAVYQVMTASKMQTSTDTRTISIKPGSSPAREHQHSGSTSVPVCPHISLQSQSFLQSKPSVASNLLSTCKSAMPPVVLPQNTTCRRRSVLVHGKQSKPQSNVKFEEPLHSTASGVLLPCPSVSLAAAQRCSGSATAMQQQTSLVAGCTDSVTIPRPRVASPHPIRIRINATDLGNTADPAAMINHVRDILSRNNRILAGAQIRIRYVSPPTTSSQSSVTPQTTAGEYVNTTVAQLDGMADSDDDVKQSEHTSPTSAKDIGTVGRRRRSKAADADDEPASESCIR